MMLSSHRDNVFQWVAGADDKPGIDMARPCEALKLGAKLGFDFVLSRANADSGIDESGGNGIHQRHDGWRLDVNGDDSGMLPGGLSDREVEGAQ